MVKRVLFPFTPNVIAAATSKLARLLVYSQDVVVPTYGDTETLAAFTNNPAYAYAEFSDDTPAGTYDFVVAINGSYGLQVGVVTIGSASGNYRLWGDDVNLASIKAKTDLITGDGTMYVNQPSIVSGRFTGPLFLGDAYLASVGRAIEWNDIPLSSLTADQCTAELIFTRTVCTEEGATEHRLEVSGTVADAGDGNVDVSFDITSLQSATLVQGEYDWFVRLLGPNDEIITKVASDASKGSKAYWRQVDEV